MQGIDISHWQSGLNLSKIKPEFVVIKATEGVNIVDNCCDKFYQQAKNLGILRGVYHFARNSKNSALAEAEFFVSQIKGYVNDSILVLDWEDPNGNKKDVAWAKIWLDRVFTLTGVRPLIYMSSSIANSADWSSISQDYGLWIANYGPNNGKQNTKPTVKYWSVIAMWQFTSIGRLNGYSGNLDLDEFYGDKVAWNKYANVNCQKTSENSNIESEEEMKTLDFLGCKNFEEAEKKLIEHLGIKGDKCAWGTDDGDGTGGFLGSERRKVKRLDQELAESEMDVDFYQSEKYEYEDKCVELEEKIEDLKKLVNEKNRTIDMLQEEINELKDKQTSCKSESEVVNNIFSKLRKLIGIGM